MIRAGFGTYFVASEGIDALGVVMRPLREARRGVIVTPLRVS